MCRLRPELPYSRPLGSGGESEYNKRLRERLPARPWPYLGLSARVAPVAQDVLKFTFCLAGVAQPGRAADL